jgi:hypothetical protein
VAAAAFLTEQRAGSEVVLGDAAKLRVALAAGDLQGAFVVAFDVAELRLDDFVVNVFAVDDKCHMGRTWSAESGAQGLTTKTGWPRCSLP